MIEAFADGVQFYDPRTESTRLLGLTATPSVDKAGTAEIILPPGHPAYDSFVSYKTLVEIYRRGELLFRGRPLFPSDNRHGFRTITCEGERCFFRDSVMRPYLYQDTPAAILADIVSQHNAQVDEFKTFQIGEVTVTDPNDYVRFESETAEQTSATIDKLIERCGGYLVFTSNTAGRRCINWLAELEYRSDQAIEFGENLLDFDRTGLDTGLATRIIPYGAKDETTGLRLTIESVNGGLDYIEDEEAVRLRGVVTAPVFWDDVTEPANLLTKAQKHLAVSKMTVTTLSLSAVDLSALDANIDTFQVGDQVRVISQPHNVDDMFLLRERTYDLLNPANDTVVLGKELTTLTGAGAATQRENENQLHRTEQNIKADYTIGILQAMEATQKELSTLIQQTSESILLEVSQSYIQNGEVENQIRTAMTQLADSFAFTFESLQKVVDENDAEARARFETIEKYIRFENGNILLGESGSELVLRIENDRISFLDAGAEVAYFSNRMLYVVDGHFISTLRIGNIAFIPRENGNTSIVKVGD